MGGLTKVMMTTCVTAGVADNAVTDVCLDGYVSVPGGRGPKQQLQRANPYRIDRSLGRRSAKGYLHNVVTFPIRMA